MMIGLWIKHTILDYCIEQVSMGISNAFSLGSTQQYNVGDKYEFLVKVTSDSTDYYVNYHRCVIKEVLPTRLLIDFEYLEAWLDNIDSDPLITRHNDTGSIYPEMIVQAIKLG